MAMVELTVIQREILSALINLFREKGRAVKGEEISERIDRNPGTVRNQMQSLKALGLVEGVPGPKGGYKATSTAYEALNLTPMEKEADVAIYRNGERVQNANVAEIDLNTVRHPELCRASVKIIGDARMFNIGDSIQVGPTPVNKLVIRGEVVGRDDINSIILCSINEMISIPKKPVRDYINHRLITIPSTATVKDALIVLAKNDIHGAPVEKDGNVIGMVTYTDIGRAISIDKANDSVTDIMSPNVISIDQERPMYEAVAIMNKNKVGRLLVTEDGKPKGMITRMDVISRLTTY
ncbi:putative transcriptional regulator [Methanocella conradii HZ254]|uniref:Transcriptional regulator n=1 Tax=Methanocella conradii (strain DSM 24694 / JCM 17849 / CGMCC 1.5162 / HZ254) TaxID=1041930 RepID=H8IA89_METCZ|nr:CBS domain-containing protein [Methanocella conradii]AFC99155.1 putative transcriptional regulator [Methanocella conradii HZ254]